MHLSKQCKPICSFNNLKKINSFNNYILKNNFSDSSKTHKTLKNIATNTSNTKAVSLKLRFGNIFN